MEAASRVRKTIEEHDLIRRDDIVILGLSGGPDSLCLLHVLAGLRADLGFGLRALHLNHLMRGEAAEEDVRFLSEECRSLDVPLSVVRCDVPAKAAAENISVEEAGRAARHEALQSEAAGLRKGGASVKIAFAHNLNDQAETVLMRVLRGTGVHGLAAMEYVRDDGVIRPLLDVRRADIEAYCGEHGLSPRFDSTNASDDYTRNRLRKYLMPSLAEEYNPNLTEVLVRLAENAREDDDCLSHMAERSFAEALIGRESGILRLDFSALRDMPPALFKRVIAKGFSEIGLARDIASVHLNALAAAVRGNRFGKTIQFPQGYYARVLARGVFLGWSDRAFIKEKQK